MRHAQSHQQAWLAAFLFVTCVSMLHAMLTVEAVLLQLAGRERELRGGERESGGFDLPFSFVNQTKESTNFQCSAEAPGQAYLQCSSLLR